MKELVVISGKGGTGKTSLVASFAALSDGRAVLADCDVDAADLHLVLAPRTIRRVEFISGSEARIRPELCTGCGECIEACRFGALRMASGEMPSECASCSFCRRSCNTRSRREIQQMAAEAGGGAGLPVVDPLACEGCGVCAWLCPSGAIEMVERACGHWMISETRVGPMVHAKLGIGGENSGKLVTTVRKEARQLAGRVGRELLLVDGSPGVGCPVIASITGASLVLIVTEPTLSGRHDLARVAELTHRLEVPAMVCVNKADLHPELADEIEATSAAAGIDSAGRVPYDPAFTVAQRAGRSLVELGDSSISAPAVRQVWSRVHTRLQATAGATSA